ATPVVAATSTAPVKPAAQTPPPTPVRPAGGSAAAPAARPPIVTAGLPAGAGREVVQKECGSCHGIDTVTAVGRTPQQWAEIIGQMQNMGLSASDEDLATIHAYLSRQLPPK
ncbi:MAG TPA: cytochrome c, partial [Brevundimonas sp.]